MQTEEMTTEQARILAAKQARDSAYQKYRQARRPKVDQLPNARQNFAAAAKAVTKQELNSVGDNEANFLTVKQKLEQDLRQPMTVENIVRVLSDGSVQGLAANPNADELHQEREQEERTELIQIIAEDWSSDEHARSVKRALLGKPHVTLESLRQQVNAIRERNRLYELTPAQIRAENAAKGTAQQAVGQSLREQDERQLENARGRHDAGNYPPLPGEIDSAAIKKAGGVTLRQWIRLYGDFQITQRLRGLN